MITEITLLKNIPLEVTPTGAYSVVQNTLRTDTNVIFVSQDKDITKRWMEVKPGGTVKFDSPVWMLQKTFDQVVLPIFEGA